MRKEYIFGTLYDLLLEPMLRRLKKQVLEMVLEETPGRTIDLCCGTGRQCELLYQHGIACVGIDLDTSLMRYAAHKAPNIPFITADAGRLPVKEHGFQDAIISLATHDKSPQLRTRMINEAKAAIRHGGKILIIDFVRPWNLKSRIGYVLVAAVERLAGKEHYENGREFLRQGGLYTFLIKHDLKIKRQYKSAWACSAVVLAEPV